MRPPPAPVKPVSFACPQCNATLTIRSPQGSLVVSCGHCGSILDARDPNHQLIARYQYQFKKVPRIPLGKRGTIRGETFECIGFSTRAVMVEGTRYEWGEYLLWSPMRGLRWLAEFGHHWTYIKACSGMPRKSGVHAIYLNREFKRFQAATAEVTFALGEFPWQIRAGDKAQVTDYVAPPLILSEEKSAGEVTWSIGDYIDPATVWQAFQLEGQPQVPVGVAPAQPSPHESIAPAMRNLFWIFLGLALLIQFAGCALAGNKVVHQESFSFTPQDAEKSRVSKVFELGGRRCNIEVQTYAGVSNNWAFFDFALIDEEGVAHNFSREVSYYFGVDEGEAWSEGNPRDSVVLSAVPAGRYYLRIEPDSPVAQLNYTVTVLRDVPRYAWFFLALPLIMLPYFWFLYRKRSFEYERWLESDFPMRPLVQLGSSEDDE